MSQSRDQRLIERQANLDGPPSDPKWWTQPREEALIALALRHGLHQNMEATGGVLPPGRRSMIPSSVSSHHLYETGNCKALNIDNCGPVLTTLYNWGIAQKISTSRPRAAITPKGWAYLASWNWMPEEWLPHAVGKGNVTLAKKLYRKLTTAKVVKDGAEAVKTIERVARQAQGDEPPGLPVFDDEVESILAKRAQSEHEVRAAAGMIGRHLRMTIGGMDQNEITEAVEQHFTPIEILRADLELLRARDANADFHTTMARTVLAHRLSAAGRFKRHTLADNAEHTPGLRGISKIAAGIEAGELERAGRARGMGDDATLGQVHERLQRESISGIAEGLDDWGREIDSLPIVDWIDARMKQEAGEDYENSLITVSRASLVAREAVLRSMRERIARSDGRPDIEPEFEEPRIADRPEGEQAGWLSVIQRYDNGDYVTLDGYNGGGHADGAWSGVTLHYRDRHGNVKFQRKLVLDKSHKGPLFTGNGTNYTGFRFEVKRQFVMDGRLCFALFTFEADNDERDNLELEAQVDAFIREHTRYPDHANVDMTRIGHVETLKIRRAFSPFWSFVGCLVGGLVGGLVALFVFLVVLGMIPHG